MSPTHPSAPAPFDPLIHEASRLVIVSVLNECESADFNFLLGTTGLTRGNLSTHMAKLVLAGYVDETKQFVNRKQLTQYRLTPAGRAAYTKYRADWTALTNGKGKAHQQPRIREGSVVDEPG